MTHWLNKPALAGLWVLLAGLALPLGFAPFTWKFIPYLSFSILFLLWRDAGRFRAIWVGYLFALGMFASGVSWVYVSLHDFGNMAAPLATVAVALFVALLALFGALAGWLQSVCKFRSDAWHLFLVMPSAWLLTEWLRSWVLTGFPWLSVGFSQVGWLTDGYAAVIGVHGVSLIVLVLAAGLAYLVSTKAVSKFAVGFGMIVIVLIGWAMAQITWTKPTGQPLAVSLVQGDVAILDKWRADKRQQIISRYLNMSGINPAPDLIVWPEAALPEYLHQLEDNFWARLKELSGRGTNLLTGVVEYSRRNGQPEFYNSAMLIPAGEYANTEEQVQHAQLYRKSHLVPFGDYIPFASVLHWILNYFHIPMSDFSSWQGKQPPMLIKGELAEVSICYEDSFGSEIIRRLPQAGILINLSEDGWFGRSIGPLQRVEMAQMLALETGRPIVRAANTGVTAFIDHNGKVIAKLPQYQPGVLSEKVQAMEGSTPYVQWGNWPVVIISLSMLLGGYIGCRRGVSS